ncbi:hypothetical protein SSPS47_20070 [Streptomyces sp. S4.7]|uniref:DUF3558 domain-containing protein n=1 Tax=unclassified Streptomyces TaxID=2593676 RepID=UPI001398A51B|nr:MULTISPECIES: DUF3558 domain-containing protein [unclassified Streptomyces]QHY97406.1 hypothetical protein SSPS47_20070 [Streptomyces sp. S4.7]
MQRKAYVPGLAALLVTLVAGCTSGTGGDGSDIDDKAGVPTTTTAPPGKYRTLREPCGSVDPATLRDLLPGVAQLPEEQREKAYKGTAAVTYDTDRRVGCAWTADSPDASHNLVIDVERVVSYDPAVSDADKAQEVYAKKEDGATLPPPAAGAGGGPGDDTDDASEDTDPSGSPSPGKTPNAATTPPGLQPRLLDDLGDAAFVDDVYAASGSAAKRRTVSVVFRTSNVVVTVRYAEQPAHSTTVPDSKELQEKARGLARKLADQLNE